MLLLIYAASMKVVVRMLIHAEFDFTLTRSDSCKVSAPGPFLLFTLMTEQNILKICIEQENKMKNLCLY